ncbi:AzlD domain-containing protein [Vogesella facilis]|uniref:AzlD domain-containing protein n=1 Tax=Vogesella facilis TaxID=1655232 RepID=A0ABV7RGM2_9NEIS
MVSDAFLLWSMIGLIGAATLLPRCSFIVAGQQVQLAPWVQRALRYAPAAALAAIIAPDIVLVGGALQPFSPKLLAAIAVVVSVCLSRNPWLPFLSGMAVMLAARLV